MNIRNIRDRVLQRLAVLRNPSEEQQHDAYSREIIAELGDAREAAIHLRQLLAGARVKHPERKWVILDKEDIARYEKHVNDLLEGMALR